MSLSDWAPRTGVGAIALIGAVAVLVGFTYLLNAMALRSADLVLHTQIVQTEASRLLASVSDAETGQRGYVITGDKPFLDPYMQSRSLVPVYVDHLAALVADNPPQVERVQELRRLTLLKLAELDRTISLVAGNRTDQATQIVRSGAGRATMDQIRAVLSDLEATERTLLVERQEQASAQRWWTTAALFLSMAGLAALSWFELHRFNTQNQALRASNVGLERLVAERTNQLKAENMRVEALLKDVTHRVGNNLAMVSALLNVQRRQSPIPEVRQALSDAQSRIQAIAAGQRRLQLDLETDEIDARPYLENLLEETARNAGERGIRLAHAIADVRLPGKDAVSYIVLTNELTTNSLKHGFRDGETGEIRVLLREGRSGAGRTVELIVEDNGAGASDAPTPGLGTSVIRTLLGSLGASLTTEVPNPGAARPGHRSIIAIPMRNMLKGSVD